MHSAGFRHRVLITSAVLLIGILGMQRAQSRPRVRLIRPLDGIPLTLGAWRGMDTPLTARIVAVLSVDQYIKRLYTDGGPEWIDLYVGYYGSQRTGELIHSPKNCLPGAGWEAVSSAPLRIVIAGNAIEVKKYVIQNGLDRQLVLYWYQERGRTISSEYWAKFWMAADAFTRNRTDGALVRVVTRCENEHLAVDRGMAFVRALYPKLRAILPD